MHKHKQTQLSQWPITQGKWEPADGGLLNAGATAHQWRRNGGSCWDHRWSLATYTCIYPDLPTQQLLRAHSINAKRHTLWCKHELFWHHKKYFTDICLWAPFSSFYELWAFITHTYMSADYTIWLCVFMPLVMSRRILQTLLWDWDTESTHECEELGEDFAKWPQAVGIVSN